MNKNLKKELEQNFKMFETIEHIKSGPVCCDDKMVYYNDGTSGLLNQQIDEQFFWLCKKCGSYIKLETGQLDEEEVDEYDDEK